MLPEIVPGCAGAVVVVTANVFAVLLPQVLFAVTEIVPPVLPVVTVMVVLVEEPDHPDGNVHV